jgi:hypothetical protein
MNETTDNFWIAFASWNPEPPRPVYFRLYYDAQGDPICYSQEDLPGNYIDVSPLDFAISSRNVRVVNGQLVKIQPAQKIMKLIPAATGTPCHALDVTVVVQSQAQHWKRKTYETN